jgi:hypothetical protein
LLFSLILEFFWTQDSILTVSALVNHVVDVRHS